MATRLALGLSKEAVLYHEAREHKGSCNCKVGCGERMNAGDGSHLLRRAT